MSFGRETLSRQAWGGGGVITIVSFGRETLSRQAWGGGGGGGNYHCVLWKGDIKPSGLGGGGGGGGGGNYHCVLWKGDIKPSGLGGGGGGGGVITIVSFGRETLSRQAWGTWLK